MSETHEQPEWTAFERRLHGALWEGPTPPGLALRLTERLVAELPNVASAVESPAPVVIERPQSASRKTWTRRGAIAAIATGAAALLAWAVLHDRGEPLSPYQLMDAAVAAYIDGANMQPIERAPGGFALPRELSIVGMQAAWRSLPQGVASHSAAACELRTPNGQVATLFVIRVEIDGLPTRPPGLPTYPATQGVCAAAWQENGLAYVLVVPGDAQDYRRFVPAPSGDLAMLAMR